MTDRFDYSKVDFSIFEPLLIDSIQINDLKKFFDTHYATIDYYSKNKDKPLIPTAYQRRVDAVIEIIKKPLQVSL